MKVVRLAAVLAVAVAAVAVVPAAQAVHNEDRHAGMSKIFESPNGSGTTNSDIAFWGKRAYVGDYGGFRIFDISDPATPKLLNNTRCYGPQNDPVVWKNKLLFLAVDRTLPSDQCTAAAPTPLPAHDDPNGWEGVRIFDVSDPANPKFIKGVYTDCGAHTITLYPKSSGQLLLYVSSYPLRPGPTCGPVRGPATGQSPTHEKIQVIRVPVNKPENAKEIAEPKIVYPGDADNTFKPSEHNLTGADLVDGMTACHDIAVFVQLRLAAGACAEQAQLWRINKKGIPRTEKPVWVFDDNVDGDAPGGGDVAVDFWHSATFSWDGRIVNFIDESFGLGCPTVTPIHQTGQTAAQARLSDTGRMFFLSARTGKKLSHYVLPRTETAPDANGKETAYCSAHLGNVVRAKNRYLLVNAWYMGGVDVIDFTNPREPTELAFYDAAPFGAKGSDNWSAYWYEGPGVAGSNLNIYATDGVHSSATGKGFQVYRADLDAKEKPLRRLNPQTQEKVLGPVARRKSQGRGGDRRKGSKRKSSDSRVSTVSAASRRGAAARLAP